MRLTGWNGSTSVEVDNNYIYATSETNAWISGIYMEDHAGTWKVENNTIEYCYGSAIDFVNTQSNNSIKNNTIEYCESTIDNLGNRIKSPDSTAAKLIRTQQDKGLHSMASRLMVMEL